MATEKIYIVGIGDDGLDGLTASARDLIERADMLVGARETLSLIRSTRAELCEAGAELDQVVTRLERAKSKKVVVLASGDPLF